MPLVTDLSAFRQKFDLNGANLTNELIESAVGRASRRVCSVVGLSAYSDALLEEGSTDLPRQSDLIEAEEFFTLSEIWLIKGAKLRPDGFLKSAQDTSSPAMSSQITNSYRSVDEITKMREELESRALALVNQYQLCGAQSESAVRLLRC